MSGFLSQFSYVEIFNFCVFLIFTCCYTYQLFYVLVVLKRKPDVPEAKRNHKFAAVISARNESAVIGYLIKSIKEQNYPQELIDVFVIADNCTDDTASVARKAGAIVIPRFNKREIGKALRSFLTAMRIAVMRHTSSSMRTMCLIRIISAR